MRTRMNDMDQAIARTNSNLDDLNHGVRTATTGLKNLEQMVSVDIYKTAEVGGNIYHTLVVLTHSRNLTTLLLEQQQMPMLCKIS